MLIARGKIGVTVASHRPTGLSPCEHAGMDSAAHAEFDWDSAAKISNYRRQAEECRLLARKAQNDEHRNHLLTMAETWERLAAERESFRKSSKLDRA